MSMSMKTYLPLDSAAVALGADDVAAAIAVEDASIELVRTGSRGMVWLEPMLEVASNAGRIGFGPLTPADVPGVLAAIGSGSTHPLALGLVEGIDYLARQDRKIFARCGVNDPLDFDAWQNAGGGQGLTAARAMSPAEVVDEIKASGLRGRGGAGFPAGIKWATVIDTPGEQKYVVCNADEGDAGTFSDRMIMEGDPFCLIEGMVIAGYATGATVGHVYLRSEYPIAAQVFDAALVAARDRGLLGEHFDLQLFVGAGSYVCGEETALLESLEGKRGQIRAKPPLPAIEGLFGCPTLIHNAISLASAPWILAEGASAHQGRGVGRSVGTMPFQLAGNIRFGGLVEVPLGITLRELINDFGGGTRSGRPLRAVQIAGPLGAYLPDSMLDLAMDYEALAEYGYGIGHGGVIVFDDTVDLANQARYAFAFCAVESCGKCTPCRVGAVRGVETMDRLIAADGDDSRRPHRQLLQDLCEDMVDGSLCAMGGMTPVPVMSAMKHFPEDFS